MARRVLFVRPEAISITEEAKPIEAGTGARAESD